MLKIICYLFCFKMFREGKLKFSFLVLISLVGYCLGVKVCPTENDYNNILSTKCSVNPDDGATPKQIVDRWMISTQTEHYLETSDGYIFQVLQCVPKDEDISAAPAVLGHGIAMNIRGYLNMQNYTLVYNLLKQHKRQVFLISFRGTIFSTGTTNGKTINQFEYWNFTYEHLGLEEVALSTSLAKQLTNRKVFYIGFSMGTTAGFALFSLKPQFCSDTIIGFVALAPVAYLDVHIPSILGKFAPAWPLIEPVVKLVCNGRILPRDETQLKYNTLNSLTMRSCYNQKAPIFGYNTYSIPWQYYPVCIINNPDAIGHYVVEHYDQNILSAKFRRFDYKEKNIDVYGTAEPPDYRVQDITVKITLVTGKNDILATELKAQKLWDNLSPSAKCSRYSVADPKFTHDNFMHHEDLYQQLVYPLLGIIKNMEAGICS